MSSSVVSEISQENSPSFAFSHPIQPDWGEKDIPDIALQNLDDRFRGTSIHPGDAVGALVRVTNIVTKRRVDLERQHSALTYTDPAAYDTYKRLAGDPSKAMEFVEHFAASAAESLLTGDGSDRSINLGGNRQYGFMNATETTDQISKKLRGDLLRKYGPHRVKKYEKGQHDLLRYSFEYYQSPLLLRALDNDEPQFGIVTRRRPVLDFDKVRIFKESVGLIVLANLAWVTRQEIKQDLALHFDTQAVIRALEARKVTVDHKYEKPYSAHDEAALVDLREKSKQAFPAVRTIFEDAIATHDDSSAEVIPVSAHYLMRMKRCDLSS